MLKMTNKIVMSSTLLFALAGCAAQSHTDVDSSAKAPAASPSLTEMALVPAGEFTMGSNHDENVAMWKDANALNPYGFNDRLYVDEHPAHKVTLPAYLMDKYEVTNIQYREFVKSTQHGIPLGWARNGYNFSHEILSALSLDELRQVASDTFRLDMDVSRMNQQDLLTELEKIQTKRNNLPVTTVTWADAEAYCRWAGKRLPTEAEWEKAARSPQGFEYPWGNKWDPKKINTMSEDPDAPYSAVGSFPGDVSPYGIYDMAANVTEWVQDWYDAYPGANPADDSKYYGKQHRVVRGGMTSSGHYDSLSIVFRGAKRNHLKPYAALIDVGFRCAKDSH